MWPCDELGTCPGCTMPSPYDSWGRPHQTSNLDRNMSQSHQEQLTSWQALIPTSPLLPRVPLLFSQKPYLLPGSPDGVPESCLWSWCVNHRIQHFHLIRTSATWCSVSRCMRDPQLISDRTSIFCAAQWTQKPMLIVLFVPSFPKAFVHLIPGKKKKEEKSLTIATSEMSGVVKNEERERDDHDFHFFLSYGCWTDRKNR